MKKLSILFSIALFIHSCSTVIAQSMTTVSATVTDSDSITWTYGTVQIQFVPNPSYPSVASYRSNGIPLNVAVLYQGPLSLGSSGAFSLSVYDNTQITPVGSQWQYTICPNATSTYGCGVFIIGAAGASQVLTGTVAASIKAPRFAPKSGTYGYADVEASLSLLPGSTYWSVTAGQQRYWNAATNTWIAGAGGGGGTVLQVITNPTNWPTWLTPSVAASTTDPSISVAASPIPNSILANDSTTVGDTILTLGSTYTTVDDLTLTNSPSISSYLYTAPAAQPVVTQPGAGATVDFYVKNAAGSEYNFEVDDSGDWIQDGQVIIPGTSMAYLGAASGGVLLVTAGPSGDGAPCEVNGCALNNSTANTQSTSDNSTYIATDAFVKAAIASATAGVASINGVAGTFTFTGSGVGCTGTTCTFSGAGIADVTVAVPSLTIPANTCYGAGGTTTHSSVSMPGVTATTAIWPVYTYDPTTTTGWGAVGGVIMAVWPDSAGGLADYKICNQTGATITTGSTTFRLAAQ